MILRKETETQDYFFANVLLMLIRMNDTPQGDGNLTLTRSTVYRLNIIRMNDTPQGDGNLCNLWLQPRAYTVK